MSLRGLQKKKSSHVSSAPSPSHSQTSSGSQSRDSGSTQEEYSMDLVLPRDFFTQLVREAVVKAAGKRKKTPPKGYKMELRALEALQLTAEAHLVDVFSLSQFLVRQEGAEVVTRKHLRRANRILMKKESRKRISSRKSKVVAAKADHHKQDGNTAESSGGSHTDILPYLLSPEETCVEKSD